MAQPPDFTPEDANLVKGIEAALAQGRMDIANELTSVMKQNRLRRMPLPDPVKLGQEGMPQAIKSVVQQGTADTLGLGGAGAARLAGLGSAPMVAGHAIANLAGADNDAAMRNWQSVARATPDTMGGNMAGNALQFGVLPAGAVGTGMGMAGRTLPRVAAWGDVAATQGGMAAATTPGDASERLWAGMLGTGAGVSPLAVGAAQGGRRMLTKEGKQLDIAEGLRREAGADADSLTTSLQGTYPASRYGVQPSAATLTRNPTLEVMETGSRTKAGDQWAGFDRMNAEARWKSLLDAAGTKKEYDQLVAARNVLTKDTRETALHNANLSSNPMTGASPYVQGQDIAPLEGLLQKLKTGEHRPNQDVQKMVDFVSGQLEQRVSPEQLYTVRRMLTDGVQGGMPNELTQAARAARPQRMEIIGAIDEALNGMSGGGWGKYLESYKIASPLINSRDALLKITDKLQEKLPFGVTPPAMGEKVQPRALGALLERWGTKEFGSKEIDQLIPQHREMASILLKDMHDQAGVLSSATKMGSPTAPLMANAGRVGAITNSMIDAAGNVIPVAGGALAQSAKGSLARMNEEALAELLKNPKKLAEELNRAKVAAELLRRSGQVGAGTGAGIRSGRE